MSDTSTKPNSAPQVEIRQFVVTPLEENCYAVISEGECMVVDPGSDGEKIVEALKDVNIKMIVATHGHGDHVGGVYDVKRLTGAPYLIHERDAEHATGAGSPGLSGRAYDHDAPWPDKFLREGDVIELGALRFEVYEAPGHSPGGVVLLERAAHFALVGDTIFAGSVGRTDFPSSSPEYMRKTLDRLKKIIPADTLLLTGHGSRTTMEQELASNPFLV